MNDYTKSSDLKALVLDDGTEDLFTFLILFLVIRLLTYIHCYQLSRDLMILQEVIYLGLLLHTQTFFKNSFFPYCTSEWNKLGPNLRNSTSISKFKEGLLAFIRPKQCHIYDIIDPLGLKLLTRLRVNLSHLREHKFHHNFLDTLNPLCSCSLEIESTSHYLLRCRFYTYIRRALLDNITNLIGDISNFSDDKLMNLLLYGDNIHSVEVNSAILKYTLIFLKSSERFDGPLLL